jgi:hypothetical protein
LYARSCSNLGELESALAAVTAIAGPSVITIQCEQVEVPPFVAFQRADPNATTVSRGESDASE